MSDLEKLTGMLRWGQESVAIGGRSDAELLRIVTALKRHLGAGAQVRVPSDLQEAAVQQFWKTRRLETLRDARLVSFGMCVPVKPSGRCIIEDSRRFRAALDASTGVDQWAGHPRWYRRCYQGLVRSYFAYDGAAENAPEVAKENWGHLKTYLHERVNNIVDVKNNPEWVTVATENRHVFGDEPCAPFAEDALRGDVSRVDQLCVQLGIDKASWFLRELILAQVRHATERDSKSFSELIPQLIERLAGNRVLRDQGLSLILNRYASAEELGVNQALGSASVDWWGNPWLPSSLARWGGVSSRAREMVAGWLKRDFIEAFFTKLAADGVGDGRRAQFWTRYVKSMGNVHFALGPHALNTRDRDFEVLRAKMRGLYTPLLNTYAANNAFIMFFNGLVVVEFGGLGNALYGYDVHGALPFDITRPLQIAVDAPNSLKRSARTVWLKHADNTGDGDPWEQEFETVLRERFNIVPDDGHGRPGPRVAPTRAPRPARASSAAEEFAISEVLKFAKENGLIVRDGRASNGHLWIMVDDKDRRIARLLQWFGFSYRAGKGWWR